MAVTYQERAANSPFVEAIWQTHAYSDGGDIVAADASWDMIIRQLHGKTTIGVWGPMTSPRLIPHAEGSTYLGIRFKLGTYLSNTPISNLLNVGTDLPAARCNTFWLSDSTWEIPTFDNVETFINRLVRGDLLGHDPDVDAALQGHPQYMSLRSVQRRILRVTGLTQRDILAIERARQAASLLGKGTSILDTVYALGYADQQSMTRALRRFLGQTPARFIRNPEVVVSGQDLAP